MSGTDPNINMGSTAMLLNEILARVKSLQDGFGAHLVDYGGLKANFANLQVSSAGSQDDLKELQRVVGNDLGPKVAALVPQVAALTSAIQGDGTENNPGIRAKVADAVTTKQMAAAIVAVVGAVQIIVELMRTLGILHSR